MLMLAINISIIAESLNLTKNKYNKILNFIKNRGLGGNPAINKTSRSTL